MLDENPAADEQAHRGCLPIAGELRPDQHEPRRERCSRGCVLIT